MIILRCSKHPMYNPVSAKRDPSCSICFIERRLAIAFRNPERAPLTASQRKRINQILKEKS